MTHDSGKTRIITIIIHVFTILHYDPENNENRIKLCERVLHMIWVFENT